MSSSSATHSRPAPISSDDEYDDSTTVYDPTLRAQRVSVESLEEDYDETTTVYAQNSEVAFDSDDESTTVYDPATKSGLLRPPPLTGPAASRTSRPPPLPPSKPAASSRMFPSPPAEARAEALAQSASDALTTRSASSPADPHRSPSGLASVRTLPPTRRRPTVETTLVVDDRDPTKRGLYDRTRSWLFDDPRRRRRRLTTVGAISALLALAGGFVAGRPPRPTQSQAVAAQRPSELELEHQTSSDDLAALSPPASAPPPSISAPASAEPAPAESAQAPPVPAAPVLATDELPSADDPPPAEAPERPPPSRRRRVRHPPPAPRAAATGRGAATVPAAAVNPAPAAAPSAQQQDEPSPEETDPVKALEEDLLSENPYADPLKKARSRGSRPR